MTLQNEIQKSIQSPDLPKRIFRGALINFGFITFWLIWLKAFGEDFNLEREMLVPVLTITFGGMCGGAFWHALQPLRSQGGGLKVLANVIGVIVHIIGGWMSLVFGCAMVGYWD